MLSGCLYTLYPALLELTATYRPFINVAGADRLGNGYQGTEQLGFASEHAAGASEPHQAESHCTEALAGSAADFICE